jgi:FKBP-type peptidyl-prolyl cis-trans isomerase
VAKKGDQIKVHYAGRLVDGTEFDSSFKRDSPFQFKVGMREVSRRVGRETVGCVCLGARRGAARRGAARRVEIDRPCSHKTHTNNTKKHQLGAGMVIKGWDQGLEGACVGEKRTLRIPPSLGYGSSGAGGVIPGGATLIFDTEMMGIN